jgi:hypothetical protein
VSTAAGAAAAAAVEAAKASTFCARALTTPNSGTLDVSRGWTGWAWFSWRFQQPWSIYRSHTPLVTAAASRSTPNRCVGTRKQQQLRFTVLVCCFVRYSSCTQSAYHQQMRFCAEAGSCLHAAASAIVLLCSFLDGCVMCSMMCWHSRTQCVSHMQ